MAMPKEKKGWEGKKYVPLVLQAPESIRNSGLLETDLRQIIGIQ